MLLRTEDSKKPLRLIFDKREFHEKKETGGFETFSRLKTQAIKLNCQAENFNGMAIGGMTKHSVWFVVRILMFKRPVLPDSTSVNVFEKY